MKKTLLLFVLAVAVFSCKKEETPDTQKPVITVLQPAGDHLDKSPGDTISLEALFTDNEALLSAKLEIHEAGAHSHRVMDGGWEWSKVLLISGMSATVSESVVIPTDAELGEYHLIFEGTDAAGNEATPVVIELHID